VKREKKTERKGKGGTVQDLDFSAKAKIAAGEDSMGRRRWTDRGTVEQCACLSVRSLALTNAFRCRETLGALTWAECNHELRVRWRLAWVSGDFVLSLSNETGYARVLAEEQTIRVSSTPCHFGGRRWWLICPGLDDNVCGRRVYTIYLPGGLRAFLCRHCYGLTYTSTQKHDQRLDRLASNPELLWSMMESPRIRESLLAVRAYAKLARAALR
jgi:hypothetical protein